MGTKRLRPPTAVLLVPMSLTLLVGPWLPGASAAATDECQAASLMDDERASRILAEERPFVPTDRDLFHTFAHPDWAEAAPLRLAAGPAPTEEETREELRAFLERRFPCAPERVRDGLKVYNDPIVRQKIPDPTLRAALASLIGTIGEPAIPHLIGRTPVTGVYFGVYLSRGQGLPGRTAGAYIRPDGTREIVFDRRNRFAPFGEFSALLFHEILHTGVDDDAAGLPEEAVASALESLVYMQTILTDPSIAEQPDSLTRFNNNHMALVRLNSGPPGTDRLTLFVPEGETNIDPLAVEPLTEFYEYYATYSAPDDPDFRERETTGHPLLEAMLESLAEPGESPPRDADFDEETVDFVDRNQGVLSPAELIAVACILRLDVPCA